MTVALPFEMEIIFESGSFVDRPQSLSGETYQTEINKHLINFDKKFEDTFNLEKKGCVAVVRCLFLCLCDFSRWEGGVPIHLKKELRQSTILSSSNIFFFVETRRS